MEWVVASSCFPTETPKNKLKLSEPTLLELQKTVKVYSDQENAEKRKKQLENGKFVAFLLALALFPPQCEGNFEEMAACVPSVGYCSLVPEGVEQILFTHYSVCLF